MNPVPAYPNTSCDSCGEEIPEGDNVYIIDGQRWCEICADSTDNVCECGNYKKEEYKKCYECFKNED